MDALRTAVVLVLLLALGYGVWVVLNHDSGVEDPPDFDWDNSELADGGVSGFGEGPYVPPGDDVKVAGSPSAPAGPPNFGAEGGTPSPAFVGGSEALAPNPGVALTPGSGSVGEPSIPPPPPGFNASAAAVDQTPADSAAASGDVGPSSAIAQSATTPGATPSGSRYGGAAAGATSGAAEPTGSRYAETTGDPGLPTSPDVPGESTTIPATSTPLAPEPPATTETASGMQEVLETAKGQIEKGDHYEALYTLSLHYGDPGLTPAERRELLTMLDQLAGKVIYSTEHMLEPAYVVRRGEDISSIAKKMAVPAQLLQNINGVKDPGVVTPGTSLKVVRGPFRAEVNLAGNELTLFLGRLYAGRFPISIGSEPNPAPGEYQVKSKEAGKAYFGVNGASFPADHPANPYGKFWIDLGSQISIHGTASSGDNRGMGCVSLSPVDAADVYGILSAGSKVLIRR